MGSRDAFGGFTFTTFRPKSIPVAPMVMVNPCLIEYSIFFFQSKLLIYCIRISLSLDQKIAGKNIKDTNDVDTKNAPYCPTPNVLRPKNITPAVEVTVVMSSPSPKVMISLLAVVVDMDGSSSMFSLLIYCIFFLKHMMSFWWLIVFFIDRFFIFRLKSVICKKCNNAYGKDRKHTNAIDISII